MNKDIIRSSKHWFVSFANTGKRNALDMFLQDARDALSFYIGYLWNNRIEYTIKDQQRVFDIKNDLLDCPSFISTNNIAFNTSLSARALKCISTQACSIVSGVITEKKRLLFVREQFRLDRKSIKNINKKIGEISYSEPKLSPKVGIELNSICLNLIKTNGHFNGFLKLSSLYKRGSNFNGKIYLPLKYTKASKKWEARGELLNSFILNNSSVDLRWKCSVAQRADGAIIGADTGMNNLVFLSNGEHTLQEDIHGHSLNSIINKLSNCKKGSKAFKKAQEHRENFINWSINQLNFEGIKTLRIERIFDLRRGKASSRRMSHFTNPLTHRKLVNRSLELGVQVQENESPWKSQRCFVCGYVDAVNRKQEKFKCLNCNHSNHSDWNAAENATLDLPPTYELRHILKNDKRFFFQKNGFFNLQGEELTVPPKTK